MAVRTRPLGRLECLWLRRPEAAQNGLGRRSSCPRHPPTPCGRRSLARHRDGDPYRHPHTVAGLEPAGALLHDDLPVARDWLPTRSLHRAAAAAMVAAAGPAAV